MAGAPRAHRAPTVASASPWVPRSGYGRVEFVGMLPTRQHIRDINHWVHGAAYLPLVAVAYRSPGRDQRAAPSAGH